ncbi:MAG TPA: hypothetical protein QF700_03165 [Prochlorococcus sp.]|nr:hypothetical protein [Prochlorococcus sp.]
MIHLLGSESNGVLYISCWCQYWLKWLELVHRFQTHADASMEKALPAEVLA